MIPRSQRSLFKDQSFGARDKAYMRQTSGMREVGSDTATEDVRTPEKKKRTGTAWTGCHVVASCQHESTELGRGPCAVRARADGAWNSWRVFQHDLSAQSSLRRGADIRRARCDLRGPRSAGQGVRARDRAALAAGGGRLRRLEDEWRGRRRCRRQGGCQDASPDSEIALVHIGGGDGGMEQIRIALAPLRRSKPHRSKGSCRVRVRLGACCARVGLDASADPV